MEQIFNKISSTLGWIHTFFGQNTQYFIFGELFSCRIHYWMSPIPALPEQFIMVQSIYHNVKIKRPRKIIFSYPLCTVFFYTFKFSFKPKKVSLTHKNKKLNNAKKFLFSDELIKKNQRKWNRCY